MSNSFNILVDENKNIQSSINKNVIHTSNSIQQNVIPTTIQDITNPTTIQDITNPTTIQDITDPTQKVIPTSNNMQNISGSTTNGNSLDNLQITNLLRNSNIIFFPKNSPNQIDVSDLLIKLKDNPAKSFGNVMFKLIKIADIAWVSLIYFIIAQISGLYLDYFFEILFGKDYDNKTISTLTFEVLLQVICIGILVYIIKNTVGTKPLNKLSIFNLEYFKNKGYDHTLLFELINAPLLVLFIMLFQYSMQDKLANIKKRMENKYYKIPFVITV
jgi:hypothetical protein